MENKENGNILYWVNFLHIYQPPTQDQEILEKVVKESYLYILDLFGKYPDFRVTLNVSGSLWEKLEEGKYFDVIDRFKKLILEKRIEIVGSAMYHPILPLIPEEEAKRQIELHNKKSREILGDSYKPKGFYLPEMAYSKSVAKLVKDLGFEWIILDEVHLASGRADNSIKYEIENLGINVIFRNRKFSKSFPPRMVFEKLNEIKDKFLITAHDGEMYGHWHKNDEGFPEKVFGQKNIKLITVEEYFNFLSEKEVVDPIEASWESTKEEIAKKIPYILWNNPKNKIQKTLWNFSKEIYLLVLENREDENYSWARKHLDKAFSSCFWWWASEKKVDVFSSVSWNPKEIENGLKEFLSAVRSIEKLDIKTRLKFEKKFNSFRYDIWERHWKKLNEEK